MNNLATAAIFKGKILEPWKVNFYKQSISKLGVGVGDGSATVLAATVTWLLKDGTSIIGSLVFATVQCTKMDSYCKRWRLFADLLNDCAIAVDLLSPALSGIYFTLVQCFSGVLRSLVGIAGGATRAALTQHVSNEKGFCFGSKANEFLFLNGTSKPKATTSPTSAPRTTARSGWSTWRLWLSVC